MEIFDSMTPNCINDLQIGDVLQYIVDAPDLQMPSAKIRLNYVTMLYDVLGYDLSADVALAATAEQLSLLVLATAGGGKTSWAQIKAILQKLLRKSKKDPNCKIKGDDILCLVYNRHNVNDMKQKHRNLVTRLRVANIKGLDIDDKINACTLHSFCDFWRKKFAIKMGLVGARILDDTESLNYMRRAIHIVCKKENFADEKSIDAEKVLGLYTLQQESMCSKELLELKTPGEDSAARIQNFLNNSDKFQDMDIPISIVSECFEKFNVAKKRYKRYDFTDMLSKFYILLETDAEALEYVQGYYEYVIADEVQDFTPLMWAILEKLVSNGTPLTCIGDEDQNIYRFRGAEVHDLLNFSKRFPQNGVYLLNQNRRCRKEILDYSLRVLSKNQLRFNKQIMGKKAGGKVEFREYNSVDGQIINLIQELKLKTADELQDTVVCFRDNACSALLTDLLEEAQLPFHIIRGRSPLSHELYKHVVDVLNILEMPCDREVLRNIYKVLPCSKRQIQDVLGFDPEQGKFVKTDEKTHFAYYYYGDLLRVNGFATAMEELIELSKIIETAPLTEIFPTIFDLLRKYFWHYKKSNNPDPELDSIFEERVKKFFCVKKKYTQVFTELLHRRSVCNNNTSLGTGVAIATFHSLKGLEFSTAYAIYLDNDIFPNYSLIENRGYSPEIELELKESENRLWYVAATRAIDSLVVYYAKANPSKYVLDELELSQQTTGINLADLQEEEDLGFLEDEAEGLQKDLGFLEEEAEGLQEATKILCENCVKEEHHIDLDNIADIEPKTVSGNLYLDRLISSL